MISIAPSGAREAAAEPQPPLHHQRDACLAFLRRLGDEGGQQLFDLCAVTVWTLGSDIQVMLAGNCGFTTR